MRAAVSCPGVSVHWSEESGPGFSAAVVEATGSVRGTEGLLVLDSWGPLTSEPHAQSLDSRFPGLHCRVGSLGVWPSPPWPAVCWWPWYWASPLNLKLG